MDLNFDEFENERKKPINVSKMTRIVWSIFGLIFCIIFILSMVVLKKLLLRLDSDIPDFSSTIINGMLLGVFFPAVCFIIITFFIEKEKLI